MTPAATLLTVPQALVSGTVCELSSHKSHSFVSSDSFLLLWSVLGISKEPISNTFCTRTFTHFSFAYHYVNYSSISADFIHVPSKAHHFSIKDKFVGMSHLSWLIFQHLLNEGCKHETHLWSVNIHASWNWFDWFVSLSTRKRPWKIKNERV